MLLSGDCLFVGDVGRPDFGGSEGAAEQYRSVQRLLELEDWVEVFPAHFEGSCGKAMCGRPSSTVGFERRYNPVLRLSMEEFVRFTSEVPARPLNMTAIMDANRGAASYVWATGFDPAGAPSITLEEAPLWLERNRPFIVDVREPTEYAAGHLPGAESIPQADLALRLSEIPEDRPVLVVCETGRRSLGATAFLRASGCDRAINLSGGTRGWREAGHRVVGSR